MSKGLELTAAGGRGNLLRLRRDLLRQIFAYFQRHRRRQGGKHRRQRRRPAARRRSRLPDEHGGQAASRRRENPGFPRRRNSRGHGGRGDRGGRHDDRRARLRRARRQRPSPTGSSRSRIERTTGNARAKRAAAVAAWPEFAAARAAAAAIKDHAIDAYGLLSRTTSSATRLRPARRCIGRADADEACEIVVDICKAAGAKTVTRSKSMLGEEIGLPHALEAAGIRRVETDLAEHIIQLASEKPVAYHLAGGASHPRGRRRAFPRTSPRQDADDRHRSRWWPRRARNCATIISRPRSAFPAPISWSPRPARSAPSPTRATPN